MTTDQIFFTILFVVGIPAGMFMINYFEREDYKNKNKVYHDNRK